MLVRLQFVRQVQKGLQWQPDIKNKTKTALRGLISWIIDSLFYKPAFEEKLTCKADFV